MVWEPKSNRRRRRRTNVHYDLMVHGSKKIEGRKRERERERESKQVKQCLKPGKLHYTNALLPTPYLALGS